MNTQLSVRQQMTGWRRTATAVAVIYHMLERGMKFPLVLHPDLAFVEPILEDLSQQGFLAIAGTEYVVTPQGEQVRNALVAMYDQTIKFEIYGAVRKDLPLPPEEQKPDDPNQIHDNLFDRRFDDGPDAVDMRLMMIDFMLEVNRESLGGKAIDKHLIVWLQKMANGYFDSENFWFELRLGTVFQEVEQIVATAYRWESLHPNRDYAWQAVNAYYTAGQLEMRKREGETCSGCGTPLAIYDDYARQTGGQLEECPNPACRRSFVGQMVTGPGSVVEERCPSCNSVASPYDTRCRGCGAIFDRSMAQGTIVEETQTVTTYETVPVWGGYYGYAPYGYYNPYDPVVDALAFSLLCWDLWTPMPVVYSPFFVDPIIYY